MSDDAPEQRPALSRHMVIQSDQFCSCSYNLFGQTVTFDERLGFPVVRCPECGRWHPAGHGSTALRPWLARLATVGLALWAGALMAVGLAIAGVLVGMQVVYLDFDTSYAYVHTKSGRLVDQRVQSDGATWEWYFLDSGQPADAGTMGGIELVVIPLSRLGSASPTWGRTQPAAWAARALVIGVGVLLGLLGGMLQSAAMWHLRGWVRFGPAMVVLALAAGIFWLVVLLNAGYYAQVREIALRASAIELAAAALGWLAGLLIGRPVFRTVLTALLPPRPRMMLAFLWQADGKAMPSANE